MRIYYGFIDLAGSLLNEYSVMENSTKYHRIPQLDGVRAISILLVLGAHLAPLKIPGLGKYLEFNSTAGLMGMSLFFCLSGFLVTSALLKSQDVYAFFVRRFARILPLAYLFSVTVFFLVGRDVNILVGHLLFLNNYETYSLTQYSSHYWSLCVEMTFYISVGLVVLAAGRRGLILVPIACVVITVLSINDGVTSAIATHYRIDEILSGGVLALFYSNYFGEFHVSQKVQKIVKSGLLLWLLVWAASCYPQFESPMLYLRPYTTALLVYSIILTENKLVLSFLVNGIFSYIAKVSYALYIIHGAARAGILSGGTKMDLYLIKRPITLLITIVGAHISTFYYEQFWMDKAREHLAKQAARDQQAG